jgi:hypothetical protein
MNMPRHRSHFAAARATSGSRLRLALRSTRTTAQTTARSPADTATHHSARPVGGVVDPGPHLPRVADPGRPLSSDL